VLRGSRAAHPQGVELRKPLAKRRVAAPRRSWSGCAVHRPSSTRQVQGAELMTTNRNRGQAAMRPPLPPAPTVPRPFVPGKRQTCAPPSDVGHPVAQRLAPDSASPGNAASPALACASPRSPVSGSGASTAVLSQALKLTVNRDRKAPVRGGSTRPLWDKRKAQRVRGALPPPLIRRANLWYPSPSSGDFWSNGLRRRASSWLAAQAVV